MPDRRARTWLFILVCFTLTAAPAWAGALEGKLRQQIRSADLGSTQVAAVVYDLSTNQTLAAINADQPMIPASNMKLVTTIAALDVLGPEFVFKTELATVASDAGDPLLIVRGDGDPAFGDPVLLDEHDLSVEDLLNQWTQVVAATGVRRFDRLLVDDRIFDRDFVHPTWPAEQLIYYYCAEVAGLNFYENCIDVLMLPAARQGQAPNVQLFPPSPFLITENKATTGNKDAYWISRAPGTNRLTYHGTVRNRPFGPVQVTIHDPPIYFGQLLAHRLHEMGITVASVERPDDDAMLPSLSPLHRVQTTLPLVLNRTNQDSENLFAESLIKRMGHQVTGMPGNWENGAAAIRRSLHARLGAGSTAVTIADGSGMSRDNRVTARALVHLLRSVHLDPDRRKPEIFLQSLATAGENGTLRKRLDDLPGNVWGKSGYLREVSSLSGYLQLDSLDPANPTAKRTFAFSFLFNGFKPPKNNLHMKKLQNEMVKSIVESVQTQHAQR